MQGAGAKAKAVARIAELQVQWSAAKAELQPKLRVKPPSPQRPRGSRQPRRRAR